MINISVKNYRPNFVSPDDFMNVTGINLKLELVESDDPANDAERFLRDVEEECLNYLEANFDFNRSSLFADTNGLNEACKKSVETRIFKFQMGVIEQAKYKIRSGEEESENSPCPICEKAKLHFRVGGMMNYIHF